MQGFLQHLLIVVRIIKNVYLGCIYVYRYTHILRISVIVYASRHVLQGAFNWLGHSLNLRCFYATHRSKSDHQQHHCLILFFIIVILDPCHWVGEA